jgi:LPPG:FO 2-phospho-L-lactate transferase
LSGGVGGAKLVSGLAATMDPGRLLVVANTGDDFEHLDLHVSPDLDTLIYTATGRSNPETGWGRAGETWGFMKALAELGGPTWFNLGDGDLAMHVMRSHRLRRGDRLSDIIADYCRLLGVPFRLVPMTDDAVRTIVETDKGPLPMQTYFVEQRCAPRVLALRYDGAARATANPAFLRALADPSLEAVFICPSNPFLSIDPILALPEIRARLKAAAAPVLAVSPIVAGRALKGPTGKMMAELGMTRSAAAVARHYRDCIDGFVLHAPDESDTEEIRRMGIRAYPADIVMNDAEDRARLARQVMGFAVDCRRALIQES